MLTPREHQAYEFIVAYIKEHEYAPTIAEIAKALGVKSRSMVQRILEHLEAGERIKRVAGVKRNIELLDRGADPHTLPLLGHIAAGQPIEAIVNPEYIDLQGYLYAQDRYLLQVKGDSMAGDHICDGDWIVCEPCNLAPQGSIVVALIGQDETTLKRIYYHTDTALITLEPSNENFEPKTYDAANVRVQAIYIGLVRLSHAKS